ncbi:lysin B [Gordonia phage Jamzy]|nr:lysin B [Gordonia phage Jamzy]
MPTTYVLGLRGTGESDNPKPNVVMPMLRRVVFEAEAGRLRSSDNHVIYVEVPYPASIGFVNARRDLFGAALLSSLLSGAHALSDTIQTVRARMMHGDRLVIMGYSLGCLAILHAYNYMRNTLAGVDRFILVASPACQHMRPPVRTPVTMSGKRFCGIASEWVQDGPLSNDSRAFHVAHPDDPIALLHPSSPLRYAVPALWELDLDDPRSIDAAVRDVMRGKYAGIITRLLDPEYRQAAGTAIEDLTRYVHGGYHTARYSLDTRVIEGSSLVEFAGRLVREAQ